MTVLIPFDRLSGPQHYRIGIIKEIEAFMFAMSDRQYRYRRIAFGTNLALCLYILPSNLNLGLNYHLDPMGDLFS